MSNNSGANNRRIAELIEQAQEKRLLLRPFFQRRQVWNNDDKERLIDTILKGYPFPEIFVAEGKREGRTARRELMLVDGQQRLTTILDYYQGNGALLYKSVPKYADLDEEQRSTFLDYFVAVRDLGTASNEVIREIFTRINTTDFALKSMEVLNAMFSGPYKQFCEQLSRDPFFERHKVFPKAYQKRMYDVTFCVILVTTLLSGYYKRDERNKEYLERYNDEFPQTDAMRVAIDKVFDFIERCGFPDGSRAWKQTDLLTLLVEVHTALIVDKLELDASSVGQRLQDFYTRVNDLYKGKKLPAEGEVPAGAEAVFNYLKAATKATNDKYARVERAKVISELIRVENTSESQPAEAAPRPSPRSRARTSKQPKSK